PDRPDRRHPARTRRGRQHLGPGRLLGLVVGPARGPHGRRGRRGPVGRDDGRYRCGAGPPPGGGHLRAPASPFHGGGQRVTTAPSEAGEPVTGKEHRKPAEPDRGGRFLPVARYVLGRLGTAVVSLFAVIVAGFFLFRILPGDPVRAMTEGREVTTEQREELRRQFGLDQPLWQQFLDYASGLLRFDLGTSFQYREPVAELIREPLGPTVPLAGTCLPQADPLRHLTRARA